MNKFLKFLIIFYRKIIPFIIRKKLYNLELRVICWYNPLLKNRVTRDAIVDLFEIFKKQTKKIKNNQYTSNNIHKIFKRHLVRSNLIDNEWWKDFVILICLPSGLKFNEINQSLIARIEVSNFNALESYEILHIYTLSIRFGLFELGYHLREKSLEIALKYSEFKKKSEIWKLKAKLSALIEKGNFLEFDKLLPLFRGKWKKEQLYLQNLREALGDDKKLPKIKLNFNSVNKLDEKFHKFLENKIIAIVSPSPVNKIDGYAIDKGADIVIRTRYMEKYSSKNDLLTKGSRCDVTYIYADHSKFIAENGSSKWPSEISWIVGKVPSQPEMILNRLASDKINVKNLNGRSIERVDKALFNGGLHGLPNIVVDILRFNPKKIILYHFDMMLTKERVSGYTPEYTKENTDLKYLVNKRLMGLAGHDPVTQFIIMKSFWKRRIVEGDSDFEKVMKMEIVDYMKNLQKNYRELTKFEF